MKKLLALTILLTLGMAHSAWAWNCPNVQGSDTVYRCTIEVFNDQGSAITSNSVVVWDSDDTDFTVSNRPYIILSTTADDPYTAGVMLTDSCADQTLCEIVVWGLTTVRVADSSDNSATDTLVGQSTVSGQAGDYATAANTCALGTLVDFDGADSNDNTLGTVFVDVDCD